MKKNLFDHFPQNMKVTVRRKDLTEGQNLTLDEIVDKWSSGAGAESLLDADNKAANPWQDADKVQGLFGNLKGIAEDLSEKTGSETANHSGFKFDPDQLFSASDALANVYQQMMRRRQG